MNDCRECRARYAEAKGAEIGWQCYRHGNVMMSDYEIAARIARPIGTERLRHTDECMTYAAETGKAFCIAECRDLRANVMIHADESLIAAAREVLRHIHEEPVDARYVTSLLKTALP